MNVIIRPLTQDDRAWVREFIAQRWGAAIVVSRGIAHQPDELAGFVALDKGERVGLVTCDITDDACEIVTLDSTRPNVGVGTKLIRAVKDFARRAGCRRVWAITTNDNLSALRFYQKRGFALVAIYRNAVEQSRKLKPTIPLIGNDGIPVRDEIKVEHAL
ncbi:MAG: GNAT family N-acetyltransferase [Chloroflexi bacterium]|nr:GNAT family N-acetyltransferase [Chloroflexota bacterium]